MELLEIILLQCIIKDETTNLKIDLNMTILIISNNDYISPGDTVT